MKPVTIDEILDLNAYELERERIRAETIELKRTARRINVGDKLSFVFENHATILFQIQEMLRAERIVKPDAIQEEIDVYNALLPRPYELSATLMIEITEASEIRPTLDTLIGIDEHVYLDIGDDSVQATFDEKQFEADRIAAVQYVRFPLGPERAAYFRDPSVAVVLRVAHPNYDVCVRIEGRARESLSEDLS